MEKENHGNEEYPANGGEGNLHWRPVAETGWADESLAEEMKSGKSKTPGRDGGVPALQEIIDNAADEHKDVLKQVQEHHRMYVDLWLSHLKKRHGR